MTQTTEHHRARPRLDWVLELALVAIFLVVSVELAPAQHSLPALAFVVWLYCLLARALVRMLRFARGYGRGWGLSAALALGLIVAGEARLDAELLRSTNALVGAGVLLGLVAFVFVARVAPPQGAPARPLGGLCVLYAHLVILVASVALGFRGSNLLRWHLLEHHRLFGQPAYYLAARPIPIERAAVMEGAGSPAQAWSKAAQVIERLPSGGVGAPNIVFILADTLRADGLAACGGRPDVMPYLNELEARSFALTDLTANASWTRASCASIFTGLLPEEHGATRFQDKLDEGWFTLPELLRDAGWQTAAVLTNWVQVGRSTGFGQGFEEASFLELHSAEEVSALTAQGVEVRAAYARAEEVCARTLEWLRSETRTRAEAADQPLFLYMHFLDPHSPYTAGVEPGNVAEHHERERGRYRQELRYLDGALSKFLPALEEELGENTWIIFTSDHGEEFWEHGAWGHGHTLYRELLWVPALVHKLGSTNGARLDAALESRDLFDLVLALARPGGADVPAWARGRARETRYASQYLDREAEGRPDEKHTALRLLERGEEELIWSGYGPVLELYDRQSDPAERVNLVGARPASATDLRDRLDHAVRFFAAPPRVSRTLADLQFLKALGYMGGTADEEEANPRK